MSAPTKDHAMTRAELDDLQCGCGRANCPRIDTEGASLLRSSCHPDAPVHLSYEARLGRLSVACAACGQGVARIQVAWAVPS